MAKVIIAGGRNYKLTSQDIMLLKEIDIDLVVSGCANGADKGGEIYAENNGIPVVRFKADWDKYGKSAGPIRNREMANYADAVVLFPGGRGTDSMYLEAKKAGLKIYDFRQIVVGLFDETEGVNQPERQEQTGLLEHPE